MRMKTRPLPLKRRMLLGAHSFLYASGIASAYAVLSKASGATILMYHSVAEEADAAWIDPRDHMAPETFRRQIAFLARRRRVVSMDDVAAALAEGRSLPAGSVAITIDDGYLDTLSVAAPILAEHGTQATLYLATGYVSRRENQWTDQLYSVFLRRAVDALRLPWEETERNLSLDGGEEGAYREAASRLIISSWKERKAILADIAGQLAPAGQAPRLTLGWDEVRRIKSEFPLLALGGHTRDHLDLSSLSPEAAAAEIEACADDMEKELGERPRHFTFPYNRSEPWLGRMLEDMGFSTGAASGRETLIKAGAPRFRLPRIEAPSSLARLGFYTGGAYPRLSILATGRA